MIYLAIQHIINRRRQSLFTLLGIFFGTAAFIVISGFFLGFREYLIEQLVSGDAHIKITKSEEKLDATTIANYLKEPQEVFLWTELPNSKINDLDIYNRLGWMELIQSHPSFVAAEYQYSTTVLLERAGSSYSCTLTGVQADQHIKITNIKDKIIAGDFEELSRGMDLIVIGKALAEEMAVKVDDHINVVSSLGQSFSMKVVGIYSSGNRMGEKINAYTGLSTAQKISAQVGKINQISVRVKDYSIASKIADEWKTFSREKVESWDQANANFLSIFKTQDMLRYATTSVILLVAGFGIYNVLSMVVMQKRKDVAILKSIGYDNSDILKLFLFQGIALGAIGSILGALTGFLITKYLSTLTLSGPMGVQKISMSFDPSIYYRAILLGVGASIIAAYIPSRSASRLAPIEIIRSGAE